MPGTNDAHRGLHGSVGSKSQPFRIDLGRFLDLTRALARPGTYEREPRGRLGLLVDREKRVLVGTWVVAPMAGAWIHQAARAIREEIALGRLLDAVTRFPTYSGAYLEALERLNL